MTTADEIRLLSVLVPAYAEGRSIYRALSELVEAVEGLPHPYEIVVVSDGSTDDTVEEASRLSSATVTVMHYEPNRGKGYALRHGFERVKGSHVAFIDADMELHPSGIARLLDILVERNVDAVVGSKTHPDSEVFYPRFRRIQSEVFRRLVRVLFRLDVADTQTGLKVFRYEALADVMPELRTEGFAFDLELLVRINDAGYRVLEGPVRLAYRFSTTTGARDVARVLADTLQLAWRRRRGWTHPSAR